MWSIFIATMIVMMNDTKKHVFVNDVIKVRLTRGCTSMWFKSLHHLYSFSQFALA